MADRRLWLFLVVQLSACYPTETATAKAKVLILGGGMAGLQISQVFNDNNMKDFLILEADSKLGGRMLATDLPDLPVTDSWFQMDRRQNVPDPFRALLDRCDLVYSFMVWPQYIAIDENGNVVTKEAHASEARLSQAINDLKEAWGRGDFEGKDDLSLQGALRIYGWHPKTPEDWAVEYYWFQLEYFVHPSALSAKRWLSLHAPGGFYENLDYQRVRNSFFGNRKIIECLKRTASLTADDPRVRLNTMVTEIQYTSSGVTVITSDGSRYIGEYAVVTFSLGVLQHGDVIFTPQLPFWKRLAINRFVMAPVTYLYVYFNQTIQRPGEHFTYMYVSDSRGVYHWQAEAVSTIEQQFNHSQPFSLFWFWLVGEEALRIEMQSNWETKQEVTDIHRKQFGPGTPEPTEVRVCNVSLNPLYHGGSPIYPLGSSRKDVDELRKPIGTRLFFAGDAYAYLDSRYGRAALVSGNETAVVMLECMNGGSCDMPQLAAETPSGCSSGTKGEQELVHSLLVILVAVVVKAF